MFETWSGPGIGKDRQADKQVINIFISRMYIYTFCKTDPYCYNKCKFMSVRHHSYEGISKNIISHNLTKMRVSTSSIRVNHINHVSFLIVF